METKLLGIIRDEVLDIDQDLTSESDLFEAGLDSMAIMQLLLQIEDHFGVELDPSDLSRDNFQTVSKIAALIESKR